MKRSAPRIVHLCFADLALGACSCAYRIHAGLREAGVDSTMLVSRRMSEDSSVVGPRPGLERTWAELANRLEWRARRHAFPLDREISLGLFGSGMLRRLDELRPDVVHLHWTGGGFMRPEGIARLARWPVVWTLHDMWPMAGLDHYTEDEQLLAGAGRRLDAWMLRRKLRGLARVPSLTVHCYSPWMAATAARSAAFREREIAFVRVGQDLTTWAPGDRQAARRRFGLPEDAPVVLFGAVNAVSNPRKGFALLRSALDHLAGLQLPAPPVLAVFGAPDGPQDLPFPVHYLGAIDEQERMADAYRAADVFVAPSRLENAAQTVVESSGCGTPVVAFAIGGMTDSIVHRRTGWLAAPYEAKDMARGIAWLLGRGPDEAQGVRAAAREHMERHFDRPRQIRELGQLYERILDRGGSAPAESVRDPHLY